MSNSIANITVGEPVRPAPSPPALPPWQENRNEVWDGVHVMSPLANDEHQDLATHLATAFIMILGWRSGAKIRAGINLSDRIEGWINNYRIPDVVVYLTGNPAKNCGTHWCGGPDLGVEIVSDDDHSLEKLPFYAKVNTRELLIVDRDPWCLSLYRLLNGELVLVGSSSLEDPVELISTVLPVCFRLDPGETRQAIEVTTHDKTQRWLV